MEYITESLAIIFSSSGIIGAVLAWILRRAMSKAEKNAEQIRAKRLEEEMMRVELDNATTELILTLSRFERGMASESELESAESKYTSCVKKKEMTLKRHYLEK